MPDPFANYMLSSTDPAQGGFVVTPSDTVDLPSAIRAVTINTGGVIVFDWAGVTWTTAVLPVGLHALRATRIRATGTTAADITGWI
jgi:hypothetical protein